MKNIIDNTTPPLLPLMALFKQNVANFFAKVAVRDNESSLTYLELDILSDGLSEQLQTKGIKCGDVVAVSMQHNSNIPVILLAIFKCQAIYLPLDSNYPDELKNDILTDANASLLITDNELENVSAAAQIYYFSYAQRKPLFNHHWHNLPTRENHGDDCAYIIYTSGTTGKPKGVKISHNNLYQFILWGKSVYKQSELACVLAMTSIAFDISLFEILLPILHGGSAFYVDDIFKLHEKAQFLPITLINTVPSLIKTLIASNILPLTNMVVNLAGAKVTTKLVNVVYSAGATKVYDLYGPTECTIYAACQLREQDKPATIGKAITPAKIYILDKNLCPVRALVDGEIYIGGACVGMEYINNPSLTECHFVYDPFNTKQPHAKMFKTGDIGFFNQKREIVILGRIDNQLKINGMRIEVEAIDHLLETRSFVQEAYTILITKNAQNRLVTYVVIKIVTNERLNEAQQQDYLTEIKRYLSAHLPAYHLPNDIKIVSQIPKTVSGKRDTKALIIQQEHNQVSLCHSYHYSHIEQQIAQVFQQLLQLTDKNIDQSFFALGGSSLTAMHLIAELHRLYAVTVPYSYLIKHSTVKQLADYIEDALSAPEPVTMTPNLLKASIRQEIQFKQYNAIHPGDMNMLLGFKYDTVRDDEQIRHWITRIVTDSPILSSTFGYQGNVLTIIPTNNAHYHYDYISTATEQRDSVMQQIVQRFRAQDINLRSDKLFSCVHISDHNHSYLLLCIPHIVFDDGSRVILKNKLMNLLHSNELCPFESGDYFEKYAQFTHYERTTMHENYATRLAEFWKNLLGHDFRLNIDQLAAMHQCGALAFSNSILSLHKLVKSLSVATGYSHYAVYFYAFMKASSLYFNQPRILARTDYAARDHTLISQLIGLFSRTFYVTFHAQDNQPDEFEQFCTNLYQAMDHSLYPSDISYYAIKHKDPIELVFKFEPEPEPALSSSQLTGLQEISVSPLLNDQPKDKPFCPCNIEFSVNDQKHCDLAVPETLNSILNKQLFNKYLIKCMCQLLKQIKQHA